MKTRNATKFQASYSILQKWAAGQHEEAVYAYFGLSMIETPQLEAGRNFHDLWLEETKRTSHLPGIFGGIPLTSPAIEKKEIVELEDWLNLAFIVDCYDGQGTIYDYKTGSTTATEYVNGFQGGVYGFGLQCLNFPVKQVVYLHYDQYLRRKTTAYRWLTPAYLKETHEWIRTNAWAMHRYLYNAKNTQGQNLYEQFNALPA